METDMLLMQVLVELRTMNRYLDMLCHIGLRQINGDVISEYSGKDKIREEYRNARAEPFSSRWTYP